MARHGAPRRLNMSRPVVALLTDFGLDDPFVGLMKAVIVARCPDAAIIDLTHGIAPQAVVEAAFWLERSVAWLPAGAVVVAVVDPGVGTARRPVVVEALGRVFVGPDNGLLASVVAHDPSSRAYLVEPSRLGLAVPSRTFHGRDVFAPVAAELAAGRVKPSAVGPSLDDLVTLALPRATAVDGGARGVVVTVDRFGNLLTNIERDLVPSSEPVFVRLAGTEADIAVKSTYGEVDPGELVALVNAFDVLEIAERDGNAMRSLGAARGAEVVLRRGQPARAAKPG
jgi:hypothetical protein